MFKLFKTEKKKPRQFSDEELFSALKEDRVEITQEQIKKARENDAETLYAIGWYYHERDLNSPKGFAWILKAAHQNCDGAQNSMGYHYLNGNAVSKDYKLAMEWFLKAAAQNYAAAQSNIGRMYANGRGVSKDYRQAMEWYLKAYKNGDAGIENNIGNLYRSGRGVRRDLQTAIEWFKKAADQGDGYAMYNLGAVYDSEPKVENIRLASVWYKRAIEQNVPQARKALQKLNRRNPYLGPSLTPIE